MKPSIPGQRRKTLVLLVVLNYLQAGLGLAINLWLANRLGAEGYGMVCYCQLLGAFAATLVGFANDRTLVRDLVQATDAEEILTASIIQRGGTAIALMVGYAVWWAIIPTASADRLPVVLGLIWGALMGLLPTAWFDARYEMGLHAAVTLGERLLLGALTLALVFVAAGVSGAVLAMWFLVASRLVLLLVQWGYVLRSFRPRIKNVKANCLWLCRENAIILGAALASMLLTHANQMVLEHSQGAASLAYYAVALQIASVVMIVQGQVVRLWSPRIAELARPGQSVTAMQRHLFRYCRDMFLITLTMVVPLALFAPWIFALCFQSPYQAAVGPLRLLCIWVLCYGPGLVVNQFLLSLRLNRGYFVLTILSGIGALAAGLYIVPRYQANGVAMILLVIHVPCMLAQGALVWRKIAALNGAAGSQSPGKQRPTWAEASC